MHSISYSIEILLFTMGYIILHQWMKRYIGLDVKVIYSFNASLNSLFNIIVGLMCVWINRHHFSSNLAYLYNPSQPLVELILDHNLGNLTYDMYHVITWHRRLRLHHTVSILGFGFSRVMKSGGMVPVVDSVLAEIGALTREYYYRNPSSTNYIMVTTTYAITRCIFVIWSIITIRQVLIPEDNWVSWYFPIGSFISQFSIMSINIYFFINLCLKLNRKLREHHAKGL